MNILLDTNAFSDLVQQHQVFLHNLNQASAQNTVLTCTIVRGAILYGVERLPAGKRKQNLLSLVTELFTTISCLPINPDVGDLYARLKTNQQLRGLSIDDNDLWIAATCLAMDATLVTRDSDFLKIPELKTVNWTTA